VTLPKLTTNLVVISSLLVFGLGFYCGRGSPQKEPVIVAQLHDSLLISRTRYSADSAQIVAHVRAETEAADSQVKQSRVRLISARANKAASDSLFGDTKTPNGAPTAQIDTAEGVKALKGAFDSLNAAYVSLDMAYQSQVLATSAALAGWARADSAKAEQGRMMGQQVEALQSALAKSRKRGHWSLGVSGPLVISNHGAGYGVGGGITYTP